MIIINILKVKRNFNIIVIFRGMVMVREVEKVQQFAVRDDFEEHKARKELKTPFNTT
jgi:hypothetical protein